MDRALRPRGGGRRFFRHMGNLLAHRTVPGAVGALPRQAVVLARSADHTLRVLGDVVSLALAERVFVLRVHEAVTDRNGIELVTADTPIEELLTTRSDIERPPAATLDDRQRERPFLFAHEQPRPTGLRIHRNAVLLACLRSEFLRALAVLRELPRQDYVFPVVTHNLEQRRDIKLLGRLDHDRGHRGRFGQADGDPAGAQR